MLVVEELEEGLLCGPALRETRVVESPAFSRAFRRIKLGATITAKHPFADPLLLTRKVATEADCILISRAGRPVECRFDLFNSGYTRFILAYPVALPAAAGILR